MRHIGDQISLHPGAFYFLVYRLAETGADLVDLFPERFKDAKIFRYGAVQVSLGQFIGCLKEKLILILDLPYIFPQKEEKDHRVNDQSRQSPEPQKADKAQYDKVDKDQF